MHSLRQYVVAIVAAAIVVAMIEKISSDTHTQKMIRLVSGLLLSVVLLSPFKNIELDTYANYFESVNIDAQNTAAYGEDICTDNLNAIITERCESYILDKANQLGANISIDIQCDTSDVPLPIYATITGNVSPYVRRTIQNMIAEDLGIPEEHQLWA